MYELSVALKYLIPRRRQLSVSIIAMLSVVVISLVVWLVVVFLSVTHGIERRWIETLVSINAPVRMTPTEEYYNSYYYLIDAHSGASDYSPKNIREKRLAAVSDPYDPEFDSELPWMPTPDLGSEGLRDPVKGAFAAIEEAGYVGNDYEAALGSLRLRMLRSKGHGHTQRFLTQVSYLASFDETNERLQSTMLPVTGEDLSQFLELTSLSSDNGREEQPDIHRIREGLSEKLEAFFANVEVKELQVAEAWKLPSVLYPTSGKARGDLSDGAVMLRKDGKGVVEFGAAGFTFTAADGTTPAVSHLMIEPETHLAANLDADSVGSAKDVRDLKFDVKLDLQGIPVTGKIPYRHLAIAKADIADGWQQAGEALPVDDEGAEGILVAASFRKQGVRMGDQGYIAYYAGSPTSTEEQRIPVFVAGFYDPGLTPAGSKFILVNREVTTDVRGSMQQIDPSLTNGINVWFDDVYKADEVKARLVAGLEERGIDRYWKVETYQEYPFAKPLLDQFQSDRLLFSLIAVIIILVACSNIISMLILLVNDKRKEIGILRAMGASSRSIAGIFAFCGTTMGILGSVIGLVTAFFTLRHLDVIIRGLSALQGREAFNEAFFGGALPNEMSIPVLSFVAGATIFVSLIAGLIPAIKASLVKPSTILRGQ